MDGGMPLDPDQAEDILRSGFCPNCGQPWVSIYDTLEYVCEQDGDYVRPVMLCSHGEEKDIHRML